MILRIPRPRLDRPVNVPETMKSAAILLLGLSSLIAVVVVNDAKRSEKDRADDLAGQLRERDDTSDCRSGLAADVTDATTTYLFAIGQNAKATGDLVGALALGQDTTPALQSIRDAGMAIDVAGVNLDYRRDRRLAFEANPTTECPAESLVTIEPAEPTTAVVDDVTSTSPLRGAVGGTTITTTRPRSRSSSTTTTWPTTTTTRPRPTTTAPAPSLCDLLPDPVTIPREIPCL